MAVNPPDLDGYQADEKVWLRLVKGKIQPKKYSCKVAEREGCRKKLSIRGLAAQSENDSREA
jgi:hypothetical protein